jgi:hypothetical protein
MEARTHGWCVSLLRSLTADGKWSWPFAAPVDLRRFEDYATIIHKPMDLGTVEANLGRRAESSLYGTAEVFAEEVRLVFEVSASWVLCGAHELTRCRELRTR